MKLHQVRLIIPTAPLSQAWLKITEGTLILNITPFTWKGVWAQGSDARISRSCDLRQKRCVMSHNTYVTFSDKLQLVPSHCTYYCHFHSTSKIPRTPVLHLNSDVIKSQPCSLLV